jgi:exocyst complex component 7
MVTVCLQAYGRLEGTDTLTSAARPHVFLMNNAHYIVKSVQSEDPRARAAAASTLSGALVERINRMVDDERRKYIQTVWNVLADHVRETNFKIEYTKGTQVLTLESGRQIKSRFTAFNDGLDAVYQNQKLLAVPDMALRQQLRQEAKDTVMAPYTAFFTRFSEVQFSKKHMEQYLRFPPRTVSTMIDELFSG